MTFTTAGTEISGTLHSDKVSIFLETNRNMALLAATNIFLAMSIFISVTFGLLTTVSTPTEPTYCSENLFRSSLKKYRYPYPGNPNLVSLQTVYL